VHISNPVKDEITFQEGLLLYQSRLIIPASMQLEMLDRLHEGHQGIVKCRERARQAIWWPGMSKQIGELVANCRVCCKDTIPPPEPLIPTPRPSQPWIKVATDLFEFRQHTYLLVIDYTSRYVEIAQLNRITSAEVIKHLKNIFARHGIPEVVISDNGPQYASQEFRAFATDYGFTHLTSSPGHASGNGEAERGVCTVKNLLTSASDPYLALLNYRSAPLANGYSPAELLMNRRLRTKVPSLPVTRAVNVPSGNQVKVKETRNMLQQKINFDHRHRAQPLSPLSEGDEVWIRDRKQSGVVKNQYSPRSYQIETDTGVYRRNRVQVNKMPVNSVPPDKLDSAPPSTVMATPHKSKAPNPVPKSAPKPAGSENIDPGSGSPVPVTTCTKSGRPIKISARFKD
jgi:hypothetical protein